MVRRRAMALVSGDVIDRMAPTRRPEGLPAGYQKWRDLLFVHWEVPAAALRPLLPASLTVDTHEGRAYVGVVAFTMHDVRPSRHLPPIAGAADLLDRPETRASELWSEGVDVEVFGLKKVYEDRVDRVHPRDDQDFPGEHRDHPAEHRDHPEDDPDRPSGWSLSSCGTS
jgi:hypothetical protein